MSISFMLQVPLFESMDERLLDAICERLQPALFTPNTTVVQEGDPVTEMLLIIRGYLKSQTTGGGRTGFLTVGKLSPGNFCGEELLPWALDPKSDRNLPSSTRSVYAETEVEAFALAAEDLKFVASQFRKLHSKQVQNTLRYYSQQWNIWAASSIQVAWRRYKKRKLLEMKQVEERLGADEAGYVNEGENSNSAANASIGGAFFAARFAASTMRAAHRLRGLQAADENLSNLKLKKPPEPDFSGDNEDGLLY
jgi:cyclic nucleotide gated channel